MIDDFFLRAILGGLGVALIAGPLGCFMVWRRMAYFGAALSHSALLGVALGLALGLSPTVGITLMCLGVALLIAALERQRRLPSDTIMGIVAHGALAFGLLAVGMMESLRADLISFLFGDILAIGEMDLALIYGAAIAVGVALMAIWRPLLSATVHESLAAVEGAPVGRVRLLYMLLIALVVGVGMKVVGLLLIVSLFLIPAAAARRLSATPEQMAWGAAAIGAVSVVLGLLASLYLDTPSGPSIVVVATIIFAATLAWPGRSARRSA